MAGQQHFQLVTIDGSALLVQAGSHDKPVLLDADLFSGISEYRESALLYQIRKVLAETHPDTSPEKAFFFVDFYQFFRWKDTKMNSQFTSLLENGFEGSWFGEDTVYRYVPFEKSQSQAKKCVISFIREDLFAPVRRRLDLSICFGDMPMADGLYANLDHRMPPLSKLYAYRGLYLTEAQRLEGDEIRALLDEARILILDEPKLSFCREHAQSNPQLANARKTPLYSKSTDSYQAGSTADLDAAQTLTGCAEDATVMEEKLQISSLFDGVGMISPRGARCFNRALGNPCEESLSPGDMRSKKLALSFQFRLPFCKGMLHTVDFHSFFKEALAKRLLEETDQPTSAQRAQAACEAEALYAQLEITDVFGVQRKLAQADIILNTSLFKLYNLLKGRPRDGKLITYYFEKLRQYDHSVYIAKTDLQQRYTGYTNLSYQMLNTLALEQADFDRLVDDHLARAMGYDLNDILQGRWQPANRGGNDRLDQYLKTNPYLAMDSYVGELIESCRRQRIDLLSQGKLEIRGDMRFLSRDLIYWLFRIGETLTLQGKPALQNRSRNGICRGQLYLPGLRKKTADTPGQCAVFRSPHLSPNENVYAQVADEDGLYRRYLGHLWRVAFLSAYSHMHCALGGADFDGDMVVLAYDPAVVEACQKQCYREDGQPTLELIDIPSLPCQTSTQKADFRYVDPQTVENTFNSNIGRISNAAMKICAAEKALAQLGYAYALAGESWRYPSKYCVILNGTEIDAAKNGIRPRLDGVGAFVDRPRKQIKRVLCPDDPDTPDAAVNAAADRVCAAMGQIGQFLQIKDDLAQTELARITVTSKKDESQRLRYSIGVASKDYVAELTSLDAEDIPGKPLIYQLLLRWAMARMEQPQPKRGAVSPEKKAACEYLYRQLLGDEDEAAKQAGKKNYAYPREAVLEKLVFSYPDVTAEEAAAIRQVLACCKTAQAAVTAAGAERSKAQSAAIRKRLLYLLQYKHDSIDQTLEDKYTIRQIADRMVRKLKAECDDPYARLQQLFLQSGDGTGWLYASPEQRKQLLCLCCDPEEVEQQIFCDFSFRGYNLLYFALQEALVKLEAEENLHALEQTGEDPLLESLLSEAKSRLAEGYSTGRINHRFLLDLCRQALTQRTREDLCWLIPAVYRCADSEQKKLIWQMFSWDEIKPCVEVKHHAG